MATGGKFVTATDVANRAGVSQSTVSRVFNPDSRLLVRDKTRKKVLEAAEELGYVLMPLHKPWHPDGPALLAS